MEVRAVVARGLEPEALELGSDVLGGDKAAPGPRRSPLEYVVGQEFEMRPHDLTAHGPGDLGGAIGLLSGKLGRGNGQDEQNDSDQRTGNTTQGIPPSDS